MNQRDKIKNEIEIQKTIEPEQCEEELLLGFLDLIKTRNQWDEFVICRHYRYGKLSYETHRFYYPSPVLINFINWAKQIQVDN